MAIVRQPIVYDGPGGPFEGVLVYEDEVETARPGVMIVPNVLGAKEADSLRAEMFAGLGYVAFVADVYGQGKRTTRAMPDASKYMDALNADRALLRERLRASLETLAGSGHVDPDKLAAAGYCFGGKCVLDMARSAMPIVGGISFHGVYDRPDYASVTPIAAKLLVCHGWDDPLCPPEATVALAAELTESGADWQLHAYGATGHAFTDRDLKDKPAPRPGVGYTEAADRRSWEAAKGFLAEVLV